MALTKKDKFLNTINKLAKNPILTCRNFLKGTAIGAAACILLACGDGSSSGGGETETEQPFAVATEFPSVWEDAIEVWAMPGVKPSQADAIVSMIEISYSDQENWWTSKSSYDAIKEHLSRINIMPVGTESAYGTTVYVACDADDMGVFYAIEVSRTASSRKEAIDKYNAAQAAKKALSFPQKTR